MKSNRASASTSRVKDKRKVVIDPTKYSSSHIIQGGVSKGSMKEPVIHTSFLDNFRDDFDDDDLN